MKDYQREFIQLALEREALRFGEFTLKSGRVSPYFFNAGLFNTGADLAKLAHLYAAAIEQANIDFDVLYGPAYKGIPLACATAVSLATDYQRNTPYAFNRKEAKDHGEGGQIVGADITNKRLLIIDDVITAGTAIRESMELLSNYKAKLAGIIISLDRQERGEGSESAIQEISKKYNTHVISIVSLDNIVEFVKDDTAFTEHLDAIQAYQQEYGINQ